LPVFATDRLSRLLARTSPARQQNNAAVPLVTVTSVQGGLRIAAANPAAQNAGVFPGQPLADARALYPALDVHPSTPGEDLKALDALAEACTRFTPWTAVDSIWGGGQSGMGGGQSGGLWLDVTGCAHLFGGEQALLERLVGWLKDHGYEARAGLADTPGAAWALARFATRASTPTARIPAGTIHDRLSALPVAGLRLDSATVEKLDRLGLRTIGDLISLPRGPLARRCGANVLKRLDQALGRQREPVSPRRPPPPHHARLMFAEPVGRSDDIAAGLDRLLDQLCAGLEAANQGIRQLELTLFRVDNSVERARIGTSRPVRDPAHLAHLFRDKIAELDPGFGIEVMMLAARRVDPLTHHQAGLDRQSQSGDTASTARLIDRLSGRLGARNVTRPEPVSTHIPERASRARPALGETKESDWSPPPRRPARPVQLLPQPAPIEVMAPVPDGPPVMFRWRRRQHHIARAEGPERIAPEWWHGTRGPKPQNVPRVRDYYRLEDNDGQRYWVFRDGLYRPDRPPVWYLHGFFA